MQLLEVTPGRQTEFSDVTRHAIPWPLWLSGETRTTSKLTAEQTAMQAYQQLRGHSADFIVKYRLYSPSEGGRAVSCQHLRCDFMYEEDNPTTGLYMIHPEFLDAQGEPVPEGTPVPLLGRASMWILVPEMRASVHRARAKIGARGYFMEGARKIADAEIERIVGLHENPAI